MSLREATRNRKKEPRGRAGHPPLERLLVVWCPGLAEEQEDGRGARAFTRVVEAVAAFSPSAHAVRAGVCAVPTRGPSRYFGGDDRLAGLVAAAARRVHATAQVGMADGLFAAVLAAGAATDGPVVVAPGGTTAFLASWPVEALERPDLADLLRRLGVRTLGQFAALPARHVLARLGGDGAACHSVASGAQGEIAGIRTPLRTLTPAGGGPRPAHQPGFWGGAASAEARAARAVAGAAALLHPEAVVVGRLQGGRGPGERARLVPWSGRHVGPAGPGDEPWPGRIPSPTPAIVFGRPPPAVLVDDDGDGVAVGADGMVSAAPARLSIAGGQWTAVTAWAGPWPADVRWWSAPGRRRQARMQLVTGDGRAFLLVRERGGWWVEGAYD